MKENRARHIVFIIYYLFLLLLVILIKTDYLTILFLLYIFFSIADIFLLKLFGQKKYVIFLVLYTVLSFLLCHYIYILIEQIHNPPLLNSLIFSFIILKAFILSNSIFPLLLFLIFMLIKIIPCIIIYKKHYFVLKK